MIIIRLTDHCLSIDQIFIGILFRKRIIYLTLPWRFFEMFFFQVIPLVLIYICYNLKKQEVS